MKGSSQQTISKNIRELHHAKKKRPDKQIIKIALEMARRSRKS